MRVGVLVLSICKSASIKISSSSSPRRSLRVGHYRGECAFRSPDIAFDLLFAKAWTVKVISSSSSGLLFEGGKYRFVIGTGCLLLGKSLTDRSFTNSVW